jgi:adenosylcobinamide-GDP ribazoletransferase
MKLFLTAVQFLTRIPVPASIGYSAEQLSASVRHFPAVGALVGAIGATVLVLAVGVLRLPLVVGVLLSLAATLLVTGAFHEDGFADACDGFGGTPAYPGQDVAAARTRILTIMKDSRIGAFGAIGLVVLLSLKVATVAAMPWPVAALALVLAHTLSRYVVLWVMRALPYVREDLESKSKPLATAVSTGSLGVATAWALLVTAACIGGLAWLPQLQAKIGPVDALAPLGILIALLVTTSIAVIALATRYLRKRLGGYTGDCLGATQQIYEVALYLAVLAWLPMRQCL